MKAKLRYLLTNFDNTIGSLCSAVMVVLLFVQVVSRYVFGQSLSWTEEIALPLFILSIYFGASSAVLRHQHLKLVILTDRLSGLPKLIFDVFANVAMALFIGIVTYGMITLTINLQETGTLLAVTGFPKWIIYAGVIVAFIAMIARCFQDSYRLIIKYKSQAGKSVEGGLDL